MASDRFTLTFMATRRVRRPWRGDAGPSAEPEGFPQWEHGAFTFEGEIERLGAIGRKMSDAPRWTRIVARVVAMLIVFPFVIGLVAFVFGLLTD